MVWKDCGYLSLTKDGKKVSFVIKKVRYIAKLEEVRRLLMVEKAILLFLSFLQHGF